MVTLTDAEIGLGAVGPQGRPLVANPDGSFSTERTITVTDPRINDGRPTNIPSMFGGREVPQGEAIDIIARNNGVDPESGQRLPAFASIEEATAAARARSDALGVSVGQGQPQILSDEDIGIGVPQETGFETPVQATSGFNVGLAQTLGLPVDLVNRALGAVGVPVSERPFLGSQFIQEGFQDLGLISPETEDPTGQFVRRIGQELGATAVPAAGVLGAGARAGARAAPILQQAAQAPGRFAAGEVGLATGAGVGAATAQQLAPGSTAAEVTGQLVGSVTPSGAAAVTRSILRGGPSKGAALRESIARFEQVGASPSVAQGTESVGRSIVERAFGTVPGGLQVANRAATRQQEAIGNFVNDLASGIARGGDPTTAGRTIQGGIDDFVGRFKARSRILYGRLNNFIQPDTRVGVSNTLRTLDELTAPITGAENISGELLNDRLRRINEAFIGDVQPSGEFATTVPFSALQGIRTRVGDLLSSKELIDDVPRGQLKRLYSALTNDLEDAASFAGPDAVRALNRANAFYARQINQIDDFLRPIANRNLPEDAFRLATQGREGGTRIRALRRALTNEQWKPVAAAVIRRMGRARSSQQDDLGEAFSTQTFLTNWNNLDNQAKRALFNGVSLTFRQDLDKIARVASQIRTGQSILSNPSGTAAAGLNAGTIILGATGLLSGQLAPVIALGQLSAGSALGSAIMTNPKIVQWLAKATEIPVSRLPGHLARLSTVVREDPESAEAAAALMDGLQQVTSFSGDQLTIQGATQDTRP